MPVHNGARFLEATLQSLAAQTFTDFEIVVCDDHSTDATPALLERWAAREPRLRVVHCEGRGICAALNCAIENARGEFGARMDADDLALPERFAAQVEFLDDHPAHVAVSSRVLCIDTAGSPLYPLPVCEEEPKLFDYLLRGNGPGICHPATTIRLAALRRVGGYRAEWSITQDIDLWMRLLTLGPIGVVPRTLLHYRLHLTSDCHSKAIEAGRQLWRLREKVAAERHLTIEVPATHRDDPLTLAECEYWWSHQAAVNGYRWSATKHALQFVRLKPLQRSGWWLLFEAMFGRQAGHKAKAGYRRLRGLPPLPSES